MNIGAVGELNSLVNNFDAQKVVETKENSGSFSKVLGDAINKVNELQVNADNKAEGLIKGENVNMHDVMLSMQEAQISMQLLIETRNKVVEAYQEINRMQL
ncbi:flagellar hook-basal body complex protein FliE [Clostridium moniliforme]|uniref:Flagellar hook-basal body complex protein FliE n=1 Tax=Clostridium moniliforme TaxID=39489 RepID=A0ABS4F1B9_9CLOT|nr:flagellar hook-basal body complex protein FliE [Clostridium moniliforme]MBP1890051.1 flagellar hook-basal body complex protein FliE [Clostridium moniliforme]